MAAHSIGPHSAGQPAPWYTPPSAYNRSYRMASIRAGVIALALLAILVLVVLT
jgi:hypothetical protein